MAGEGAADERVGKEQRASFGSCCAELKEAMSGREFEPLITVGPDGILYISVGLIEAAEEDPVTVDHPLFFCPFCGARQQTAEEVRSRAGGGAET
jgi:hypothetical protein